MRDIILPEAKPALEWVNGRALQKVSPQRKHSLAQSQFGAALLRWAEANRSGEVGTEWEFRVAPPGEQRRPLVPDVAYLAFGRIPYDNEAAADIPRVAPDAVVEVLSPRDRPADVREKVRVYLSAGTAVVFLVDTDKRTVAVHDSCGVRMLSHDDVIVHEALPSFELQVAKLFDRPRPR